MMLFWWVWFQDVEQRDHNRKHMIATLAASFFAMLLARTLALSLPFRLRPLHDAALGFQLPYTLAPRALQGWSAFPSDHAVLFFCLSTGMLYVSRRMGVFALLYTFGFICLPRIYLGLHYPSDIAAGGIIGCAVAITANKTSAGTSIGRWGLRELKKHRGFFYSLFFLISYQIADMFDSTRAFGTFIVKWISF